MKKLRDLRESFQRISGSQISLRVKKALLESIKNQLIELSQTMRCQPSQFSQSSTFKLQQTQTNFTAFSHLSLNSQDLSVNSHILPSSAIDNTSREERQASILQKQRLKQILNEEIENHEDDHFHLQKILLTKKEYLQDLDNRIAKKTYQIGKISSSKSSTPTPVEEERKGLSYRIKNFFLL